MSLFRHRAPHTESQPAALADFDYLEPAAHYFDSACQTLRPRPVIAAMTDYFEHFNACGGRVKYEWGEKVDTVVDGTRERLLEFLDKKPRDYAVAFCLNTTSAINLVLQQLPAGRFQRIVTSEIEHNSVFLPTQTCARRFGIERLVLPRLADGALDFRPENLERAVVVVNATSNIDGRNLTNLSDVVAAAHQRGGIVIVDAAQTMSHSPAILRGVDVDVICGSAHKMYGPSLGFIVIRRTLLKELDCFFLGGGTVSDVREQDFDLLESEEDLFARLEPGLQDFAGVAGFGAALEWQQHYRPEDREAGCHQSELAKILYESLAADSRIKLINTAPSPILAFSTDRVDAHRLALYLSAQNIMVRSGYFCCHYYLQHVLKSPPLLRLSVGLHNTAAEVNHVADVIHRMVSAL